MKHLLIVLLAFFALTTAKAESPNLLIITVDDMSCDSVGAYGCVIPDLTPNMDRIAAEGMRFDMAHVQVGNCYPSRNVMFSGLYPHTSGIEGFYKIENDFPVFCDVMQDAGYFAGIRGKVSHSTPYNPYHWDADLTVNEDGSKLHMKDVPSYGLCLTRGIEMAEAAGKPFAININISDPHKPFWFPGDPHKVSKEYTADDITVPGFLFNDHAVREELALYYTSVRRADDAVGSILDALDASGKSDNTIVVFLSDHGMPLPYAKTQLYHHSTHTPLMVRWPGVVDPGSVDDAHMVSAIDFLSTFCEMVGAPIPDGVQGTSFVALLKGGEQEGRDAVFKEYNENSGAGRHPIRGVQTAQYLYLFNPWSDGENVMKTATTGTATYRRMKELAPEVKTIGDRLEFFDHRVVEELYDVQKDPDCLVNLVDSKKHREALAGMQNRLLEWMKETDDHALEAFEGRSDPGVLKAYIDRVQAEANERRAKKRKASGTPKQLKLIQVRSTREGNQLKVSIPHKLPADLGEQKVHVTLKANKKRVERQILPIKKNGKSEVTFTIPDDHATAALSVAAFVGEEYGKHLQIVQHKVE
ncbi:MAG: sulfatase family protein [Verrucomicrobiales bacterium]